MSPKLSIIIPCYNCTLTLEEAVASVYTQNLTVPFEIIMVDDKSKDGTAALMQKLATQHSEIKLFYHSQNKGGGAARNTGITKSHGELIFCLDSDNLLYPQTMQKMVDFIESKKCDGAVIHERRYFKEQDQAHFSAHFNPITDKPITFENLFDNSSALLDNFLFTREAYNKTIGYPEEHGFDTQCFEFRFLAAGNLIYVCPGTIFLHRQAISTKGYFHRVYEEGLFSVNFYLIFEEVLHLFSTELVRDIIQFDIFTKNKLGSDNIKAFLSEKYLKMGSKIFRKNFSEYLTQNGAAVYNSQFVTELSSEDMFIKAVFLLRQHNYKAAYDIFQKLTGRYPNSHIIRYNQARCELALAHTTPTALIEWAAIKHSGCKPIPRNMELDAHPFKIFLLRIAKLISLK